MVTLRCKDQGITEKPNKQPASNQNAPGMLLKHSDVQRQHCHPQRQECPARSNPRPAVNEDEMYGEVRTVPLSNLGFLRMGVNPWIRGLNAANRDLFSQRVTESDFRQPS